MLLSGTSDRSECGVVVDNVDLPDPNCHRISIRLSLYQNGNIQSNTC